MILQMHVNFKIICKIFNKYMKIFKNIYQNIILQIFIILPMDQCIVDKLDNMDIDETVNNTREIYSVDIDASRNEVIYGGANDRAEIYNYKDDYVVCTIMGFSESVLYVKNIKNNMNTDANKTITKQTIGNNTVIATVDGTVILVGEEGEINRIEIDEEISVIKFNENLVIGTVDGKVYLYDDNLDHINTCGGHDTEILDVDYNNGRILSMSSKYFTIHDHYGRCLQSVRAHEMTAFCYISEEVYCIAKDGKVQIYKDTRRLFEVAVEGSVESIVLIEGSLVIGGSFDGLMLIDTEHHYAVYKHEFSEMVMQIKAVSGYKVLFSTTCDRIGYIDIRDIKSLKYYEARVGVIYDFAIDKNVIIAGGEEGINVFNLEGEVYECSFSNSYMEPEEDNKEEPKEETVE